jgi:hypothetical protein
MRNKVAKRLRRTALEMAKQVYGKISSTKINFTGITHWQKGCPMWCYGQLKIAYKNLTRLQKEKEALK